MIKQLFWKRFLSILLAAAMTYAVIGLGGTAHAVPGAVTANKTLSSVAVDGNLNESVWNLSENVSKTISGTLNNTVSYDVLWDNTYLYVGIKAIDSSLFNDSVNIYDDDSFDIYIDANHNKGTSYDSFDRQFQVGYNDAALVEKNGNTSGVLHATAVSGGGFSAELAIPWSSLGVTASAGMVIGFDIAGNDDDNGGVRDSQSMWNGTGNNWFDTSAFGDLTLSATTVGGTPSANKTLSSPNIDGNLNEAVWSLSNNLNKTISGTPNNTVSYGVLWDNTYLYVGIKAIDSSLFNDSVNIYDDDSFDIYIDANHNKGTSYDSFDRQFQVGYNDAALVEKNGNTSGVLHATAVSGGGFSAELAIPWSSLGVTASAGMVIGFDIAGNDDDNGGVRDSQLMWNGTSNNWFDTSGFGDLTLSATTVGTPTTETIGGGTKASPAQGPTQSFTTGGSGFVLVKNWNFGSNGTIKNISDMNGEFFYHDQFGTIGNGSNYGAVIVAPDAANAISGQPIEDPNHRVRQFFSDSLQTYLVPLNGATTVTPTDHNAGNGSFMAKWKLPNGGSLLNQDILWETRVRYVTPPYFWFAIWNAGNIWNGGAEMDVVESFGWDNGPGGTNYDGNQWHSNSVGGTDADPYANWANSMAAAGITSYNASQYHTWQWLYRKDNTFSVYVDGTQVQTGTIRWTESGAAGGTPIDMDFLFDAGWGHTGIPSVNHSLPASAFDGKYYEWDYSRVYLR